MAIDFLARFVREANIQGMSETQYFDVLSSFPTEFADSQYEAGFEMATPEKGEVLS